MVHFVLEKISKAGQMNWVPKVIISLIDVSSWKFNSELLFSVVREKLSEAFLSSFNINRDGISYPVEILVSVHWLSIKTSKLTKTAKVNGVFEALILCSGCGVHFFLGKKQETPQRSLNPSVLAQTIPLSTSI